MIEQELSALPVFRSFMLNFTVSCFSVSPPPCGWSQIILSPFISQEKHWRKLRQSLLGARTAVYYYGTPSPSLTRFYIWYFHFLFERPSSLDVSCSVSPRNDPFRARSWYTCWKISAQNCSSEAHSLPIVKGICECAQSPKDTAKTLRRIARKGDWSNAVQSKLYVQY